MKTKSFDCVKMKQEAQKACEEAYRGLSLPERQKSMMSDIMADPKFASIYGRFFDKSAVSRAAEAKAEYKTGT